MEAIVPYLLFNGNAKQAFDFYAKALGGEIMHSSTYGESPMPSADADKGRIMHATIQAGSLTLMASDCPTDKPAEAGTNISLSMNFTDSALMDKTFAAMAEGGKITMELQDTFWGARFGMLKDQFGVNWMFNHDKPKA
jgi:PhnB protein